MKYHDYIINGLFLHWYNSNYFWIHNSFRGTGLYYQIDDGRTY